MIRRLAVLALAWLALSAASDVAIRFAPRQQPPPPDIPLEGRRVSSPFEGGSGDRGPLGALIARRAAAVDVTWWDAKVFVKESAARDYLARLLRNPRGATLPHIFWAQMLPVASLAADVVDTDGRRGTLLVWHQLPSVYAVWRDADARWWFAHWMDDPDLRVPFDAP